MMNRKLFYVTLTVLLVLLLSVSGAVGQEPEPERGGRPQGDVSITAILNSHISYQGILKESGTPVTGGRDMTFRLYSDSSCTTQVGSDIVRNGVTVVDGLFSVKLDVDQWHFSGQGLWLGVDVGGTSIACQEILPVPYALSLRPGAYIADADVNHSTFSVENGWPGGYYPIIFGKRAIEGWTSDGIAVWGAAGSGTGVYGYAHATSGTTYGVHGESASTSGRGVYGYASATTGFNAGVYGESASTSGSAVAGYVSASSGTTYGVYGVSGPNDNGRGVYGISSQGYGVYGETCDGYAVYGSTTCAGNYAGYFDDNVHIAGSLSKGGGGFKIDHPLDPENQHLNHSFVESPDMMNVYNGNVVLNANGEAWVELPDYFEALNRDFRYQLTPIGAPGPNLYIAGEISGNRFKIAGGQPGSRVSWQVTGIRQDAWANAHRVPVEEKKPADERGYYLHPELYGQPESMSVEWAHGSREVMNRTPEAKTLSPVPGEQVNEPTPQ